MDFPGFCGHVDLTLKRAPRSCDVHQVQLGRSKRVYEFIRAHRHQYDVRQMCRVLEVTYSGYYAWLKDPQSRRAIENMRLLKLIRASFNASNGIYGSPRVFPDLREAGETCSKHRVARLMRVNRIRPVRGYSRKPAATHHGQRPDERRHQRAARASPGRTLAKPPRRESHGVT